MLVISGLAYTDVLGFQSQIGFNLAIEMLVSSGQTLYAAVCLKRVSISQSRCLSVQVRKSSSSRFRQACFNLAIEMLVMSGLSQAGLGVYLYEFQSRNRDACHFRQIEDTEEFIRVAFQSRNRDACHFRTECL